MTNYEKTEMEIERDVFRIVRDSELCAEISGKVYRDGQRPKNADSEDIVVKFLEGVDGQEQHGIVLIHIYVPDKAFSRDGERSKDVARISQLEIIANRVLSSIESTEYLYEKDDTPRSYPVEGLCQHFINIRLHYRRKTF